MYKPLINQTGITWCGAFVSWCIKKAVHSPPPLSARAAMWKYWKQIDNPIYGAIGVIDWDENEETAPKGTGIRLEIVVM